MDYSLVLRNGHVIDPSQSINRVTDVAVRDGRISDIGDALGPGLAARV
jgi:dihydroorotase